MASWKSAWIELEHHVTKSSKKLNEEKGRTIEKQIVNEMIDLMKLVAEKYSLPEVDNTKNNTNNNHVVKEVSTSKKPTVKKTTTSKKRTYTKKKKNKVKNIFNKTMNFLGLE